VDRNKIQPKNVLFVLDRTGSMAGEKIDQAKDALKFCVNSLRTRTASTSSHSTKPLT